VGVDVVIVNWNGGSELVAAVTSALRFGGRPIVVDNASTEVAALGNASQLPGVTVIRHPRNLGFAAGCNTGAAAGTGDVVLLLNPDAEIVEGTAADLELAFGAALAMLIGPRLEDPAGRPLTSIRPAPSGADLVADLLRTGSLRLRLWGRAPALRLPLSEPMSNGWIVGSALAARRTDWDRLGGLDAGFFLWYEDVDFGARAARAGGTIDLGALPAPPAPVAARTWRVALRPAPPWLDGRGVSWRGGAGRARTGCRPRRRSLADAPTVIARLPRQRASAVLPHQPHRPRQRVDGEQAARQ
jgi:GT2 family glycosyltransferase